MEGEKKEYNHDNELPLSTCNPQISILHPQQAPVCITQPQSSNLQQQQPVYTTQPQALDRQPQQSTYAIQMSNTSLNTKWNAPHPAIVTKTVPVRRETMNTIPPTYLSLALCSCIFCFWPVGACAVIYSLKTSTRLDDGDLEGAQAASKKALILSLSSIGIMMSFFVTIILALIISNNTS